MKSRLSFTIPGAGRGALLLVLVLVLGAWAPIDPSRPVWSGVVPFAMTSPGSADLGLATTEAEVQRGMLDWTLESCTSLEARWGGTTATRPRAFDGVSVIGWVESGWAYDASAIGVTRPQFGGGRIGEADMEMNGVNYTWITGSGPGSNVNAYSIILHEGGHYYGLDHSSSASAAMYYAYTGGIAEIGPDDRNGICALYPGSGTDCTTTGCPSGQMCVGGACTTVAGDGNTCSSCSSGADCTAGICLRYPDGAGYCGTNCASGADCGSGEMCLRLTGAPAQCIRFSGGSPSCAGTTPTRCTSDANCAATEMCDRASGDCVARPMTGTGPLGSPCGAGPECMSGLCFSGVCSQSCDGLNPDSCPGGFYCNGQSTGTCGEGLCLAGSAGGGALGAACANNTDCSTLFCSGGTCSEPCIPGGAVGCPDGYACQVGAIRGCGACQADRAGTGDPCAMNEDCASGLCAVQGGVTFCTALCEVGNPDSCEPGFDCELAGAVAVCVPGAGGLGSPCGTNEECVSGICAVEGGDTYCTRLCDTANTCPGGFSCVAAEGDTRICRPANRGGCGCSAAGVGRGTGVSALLGLVGLAFVLARRRR